MVFAHILKDTLSATTLFLTDFKIILYITIFLFI